jgi:hypothetical protein
MALLLPALSFRRGSYERITWGALGARVKATLAEGPTCERCNTEHAFSKNVPACHACHGSSPPPLCQLTAGVTANRSTLRRPKTPAAARDTSSACDSSECINAAAQTG